MIDKIYRNDSEGYAYAKNYKRGFDSTEKSNFQKSLANAADSFSVSEKTKMQNSYSDFLKNIGAEVTEENLKAVKSIESRLNYFENTRKSDINNIAKTGAEPGKNDSMSIYKAICDQKEEQEENDDNVSTSLQEYGEKHPEIYNDIRLFKIAKALFKSGMAVTDLNVDKLVSVGDMLSKIGTFTDADTVNFFKGSGEASAENINTSKHIPCANNGIQLTESQVDELIPDIEKLFERNDIANSPENMKAARLFVANDIPVSKENIEKAAFLRNTDFTDMYDYLAKAEAKGEDCAKADLYEISKVSEAEKSRLLENYIKVSDSIRNIDISVLQKMYENGTPYTLKNISDAAMDYLSDTLRDDKNPAAEHFASAEAVTAKRKIVEIQLRMTNEAMIRLSGKGIDITSEHIEKALVTLKKEEREISADLLLSVGARTDENNISLLADTMNVKNMFANTVSMKLFEQSIIQTTAASFNFKRIADQFESLELAPSAKYGDTLPYKADNLSALLTANNFDDTKENRKAAEIISRNNMDLTEDNILTVKTINLKFEKVYNKLHPLTVAQMIKDGINPLDISLDNMLEYIDNYNEIKGQTSKEKIAEYIVEAENSGKISDEEKKAITAIYRALNMAQTHGSAALGLSAEGGKGNTIGELLSAAKAFTKAKKSGFENKIDDNFGLLEGVSANEDGIRNIVNTAVTYLSETETKAAQYTDLLIERLIDVSAPEELTRYMRDNNTFNEKLLENVYEGLKKIGENGSDIFLSNERLSLLTEQIRTMKNGGKDVINWLTENNIPLTVNNISAMAKLMADSFASGRELNKADKEKREKNEEGIKAENAETISLEDESTFSAVSDAMLDEIDEARDDAVLLQPAGSISEMLIQLQNLGIDLDLQKSINSENGSAHQIPVRLSGGRITNLNVYSMKNNGESPDFKGFMNIETQNFGIVGAYITVREQNISVKIKSSEGDISAYAKSLSDMFASAGLNDTKIQFYSDNVVENIFSNTIEKQVEDNAPDVDSDVNVLV